MMYKAEVTVCSESHANTIDAMQSECTIFEC